MNRPMLVGVVLLPIALASENRRPLRVGDAVFRVPDVSGRALSVADCDGDGKRDLAVERGVERRLTERIDVVSSADGSLIRTLWRGSDAPAARMSWDAGGDADDDGADDLVVGLPVAGEGDVDCGRVLVVDGRTSATRLVLSGPVDSIGFGTSVAFVGDLDGDGCDDFVIGVPQSPIELPPDDRRIVSYSYSSANDEHRIVFEGGVSVNHREDLQRRLGSRSVHPGYVTLRSGRDGAELWRVDGDRGGHGLGTRVVAVGDVDADGAVDFLAQCDVRSTEPIRVYSFRRRAAILSLPTRFGPAQRIGDVDADGAPDIALDSLSIEGYDRFGSVQIVSGRTGEELFRLPYPDMMSPYGVTADVGDLDGDGRAEIALGEPNFNLRGPGNPNYEPGDAVDLAHLTLNEALAISSNPWCAFSCESGCTLVYSGRTREVLTGAWGPPGSMSGLGFAVVSLPDVSGDGWPDLFVTDETKGYAFRGPGPSR